MVKLEMQLEEECTSQDSDTKEVESSKEETIETEAGTEFGLLSMVAQIWPVLLGNTLEWYEFGIYGYLAPQIQSNFFGKSAVATWCAFAVTFLFRPVGGVVFGRVADLFGRRPALRMTILGMMLATVGPGLLPSVYLCKEFTPLGLVLLLVLRAMQGLCVGGEASAVACYMMEQAPVSHLGRAFSVLVMTQCCGFLLASLLASALTSLLTHHAMLVWGWRVPFLLSFPLGMLTYISRARLSETKAFEEARAQARNAAKRTTGQEVNGSMGQDLRFLVRNWRIVLIGMAAIFSAAIIHWAGIQWPESTVLAPSLGANAAGWVVVGAQVTGLLAAPFSGCIVDRHGAAWLLRCISFCTAMVGLPIWILMQRLPGNLWLMWLLVAGYFGVAQILALTSAYLFMAELFPTRLRGLGMGLVLNGAMSFIGLTPLICQGLLAMWPLVGPGLLISGGGLVSALAVQWALKLRRSGTAVTHCRSEPYCGAKFDKEGKLKVLPAGSSSDLIADVGCDSPAKSSDSAPEEV